MTENIAVIVTYKRLKLFRDLIESVSNQDEQFDYVYVVDNENSELTKDLVRSFGVKYIYLNPFQNLGCAGGFNFGLNYLLDRHNEANIVFLDDDVILRKNFLSVIIQNELLISGNCIIPSKKYVDGSLFIWSPKLTKNKLFVKGNIESFDSGLLDYPIKVENITFEGCVIKLNLIRKIGLPNKDFFIDGDDFEYGLRINNITSIYKIPDILIERQIKIELVEKSLNFILYKFKSIRSKQTTFRLYYEIRNKYLIANFLGYSKVKSLFYIIPHYFRLVLGIGIFNEIPLKEVVKVFLKANLHGITNRFGEL
jgi:GT2 family glycosyltransferase